MKRKILSLAVRGAVGLAITGSTLPNLAFAQEQEQEDVAQLEELFITGSRIARTNLLSTSPVQSLDRVKISEAGSPDIGSLLQSMPSMGGAPIGTTTNNGGDGSVRIDLRGLGGDRTLTLINGNRTVDQGDYQTIPQIMIGKVEVLLDGGSAVYGADAVAGVVNILTRKDFEGVEFEAQTSNFNDVDNVQQDSLSMIVGKQFGGEGRFVMGAEYVTQEGALQSDTPWDFFQNSYYIYPEGCERQVASGYDGTSSGGCYTLGSSRIEEGRLVTATQGSFMNEGDGLVPLDPEITYNYAPVNLIQTPYERFNLFVEGEAKVAENVTFFGELRGNLRTSAQQLAPSPYDSRTDPAYSGFYDIDGDGVLDSYNGISENNYYLSEALAAAGLDSEPLTEVRRRISESNRRFEQTAQQYQSVFGFKGTYNDLNWSAAYNRGSRSLTSIDYGQMSGARLQNALGPSADLDGNGVPECYTDITNDQTFIESCVPLNLVGGVGTITQEMLDNVEVDLVDTRSFELEGFEANISGLAMNLPGGALGWAAGFSYREESYVYTPDSGKALGAVTGNTGTGTDGNLINTSLYGEIAAPLLENLEISLGARYDDYDAFDGEFTYSLGALFSLSNSIKLRSKVGTVFRAPTISDLFGGEQDGFPTYSDPCDITNGDGEITGVLPAGCAQSVEQTDSQLLSISGGNPDLLPESGTTFTAGAVWTPNFKAADMTFTVDYWDTKIDNAISSLGTDLILTDCYENLNTAACDLITRDSQYRISELRDLSLNVAEQGAKGIDFEFTFEKQLNVGKLKGDLTWSHLLERTKIPSPGADTIDLTGRYTDPTAEDGGAYARNKFNYTVGLTQGAWSVSYKGEFIGGLDADTFCNCGDSGEDYIQKIDSTLYHDLIGSYTFAATNTSISGGITNITNEAPPFIEIGFNASTEPSVYRMFGRGYYLRLTQSF